MNDLTQQLITLHEGRRSKRYLDSMGHSSIGIGHNLDAAPPCAEVVSLQEANSLPVDDGWLDSSIDFQYRHDLQTNCAWLYGRPWWNALTEARQAAVSDMAFNLGPVKMQAFQTFLGLLAAGDFAAAAADLLKTKVAAELPGRYQLLASIIERGTWP